MVQRADEEDRYPRADLERAFQKLVAELGEKNARTLWRSIPGPLKPGRPKKEQLSADDWLLLAIWDGLVSNPNERDPKTLLRFLGDELMKFKKGHYPRYTSSVAVRQRIRRLLQKRDKGQLLGAPPWKD